MVLQINSEVNDEDENAEDEEGDEIFVEMSDEGANEGAFFFIDITSLRQASMWTNHLIKFVSIIYIANLFFCYYYEEGSKRENENFSCDTDDEGMCILV